MFIRRAAAVGAVLALVASMSLTLGAQKKDEKKKLTKQETQEIDNLLKVVDAAAGQPAPHDFDVTLEQQNFMRNIDGKTFAPMTILVTPAKAIATDSVLLYVRMKSLTPPAPVSDKDKKDDKDNKDKGGMYAWDAARFLPVTAARVPVEAAPATDGAAAQPAQEGIRLYHGLAVNGGEYELTIAVRERAADKKNAPAPKTSILKKNITVPDFNTKELATSSLMLIGKMEPVAAPPTPESLLDDPYAMGASRMVPAIDNRIKKSGELNVVFFVYGTGLDETGKPSLTMDYSFYQKQPDGTDKYFNKTKPQEMNASTLPPTFDLAKGSVIPGGIAVPVASFPEGTYRLEVKITDKITGKTLTKNLNFSVVA